MAVVVLLWLNSFWIHALQHHTEKQSAWSHTLATANNNSSSSYDDGVGGSGGGGGGKNIKLFILQLVCSACNEEPQQKSSANKTFTLWKFWLIDSIFDSVNYSHFYARTLQFPLGLLFVISCLNYFSEKIVFIWPTSQWLCVCVRAPLMEISRFSMHVRLSSIYKYFFPFFVFSVDFSANVNENPIESRNLSPMLLFYSL